jgi:hypothetical protein
LHAFVRNDLDARAETAGGLGPTGYAARALSRNSSTLC